MRITRDSSALHLQLIMALLNKVKNIFQRLHAKENELNNMKKIQATC